MSKGSNHVYRCLSDIEDPDPVLTFIPLLSVLQGAPSHLSGPSRTIDRIPRVFALSKMNLFPEYPAVTNTKRAPWTEARRGTAPAPAQLMTEALLLAAEAIGGTVVALAPDPRWISLCVPRKGREANLPLAHGWEKEPRARQLCTGITGQIPCTGMLEIQISQVWYDGLLCTAWPVRGHLR